MDENTVLDIAGPETDAGSESSSQTSETIIYDIHLWDEHPMMTTSFQDYSVAEGLLLLIFVLLLLDFFLNLIRRWF